MRIICLKEVMYSTGLARSTIYKYVDQGTFPRAVPRGGRSIGWLENEVQDWILCCIEARDSQFPTA
ncbi:AlpA family phage regulatory protein [Halopseudomonas laoshanensis]|uniref:AlpA family phage regulatory protein n=1 Tax=Halopseudomonas laoshanensis TaxID=2268758 RepID=UPI003734C419